MTLDTLAQVVIGLFCVMTSLLVNAVSTYLVRKETRHGLRSGCGGSRGKQARASSAPSWYEQDAIRMAPWQPPAVLFGIVWLILDLCTGTAITLLLVLSPVAEVDYNIWATAVIFWLLQLVLKGLWTPFFFGLHATRLALAVLILNLLISATTAWLIWMLSLPAAILMIIYCGWLFYAMTLNFYIVVKSKWSKVEW